MAGLPSRAGERCAVEQRHRTMTTCHQGRARNASALRPPQAAQPDGRAGCVAAKPPFSTANGGGSVHEPAGPAACSLPTWRQSAGLCAARRRVAVCMDWLPAARAYTPPPPALGRVGERASSTPGRGTMPVQPVERGLSLRKDGQMIGDANGSSLLKLSPTCYNLATVDAHLVMPVVTSWAVQRRRRCREGLTPEWGETRPWPQARCGARKPVPA